MKKTVFIVMAVFLAQGLIMAGGQGEGGRKKLSASDSADERGYTASITLVFEESVIIEVEYDEVKGDVRKSTDAAYNKKMNDETGTSWNKALVLLVGQLRRYGDPDQVDVVTGATGLSMRFKKLAAKALESK